MILRNRFQEISVVCMASSLAGILFLMLISSAAFAEWDDAVLRKVVSVGAYSKNGRTDCFIVFDKPMPTSCVSKYQAMVSMASDIGRAQCTLAISAFATEKEVDVAGLDFCDTYHGRNFDTLKLIMVVQ